MKRRTGSALVMGLVAMAILAVLMVSTAHLLGAAGRSVELSSQRRQAESLARSGVEQARAKLASDPGYQGETWTIPAEELDGERSGLVEIRVTGDPDGPIEVTATYPVDPIHRVQVVRRAAR